MDINKPIIAYKAFDRNMRCRDFQFAVGKTYTHSGEVVPCESGFHACENPLDVLNYYDITTSRFAEVELDPDAIKHGDKLVAGVITVKAELSLEGFIKASLSWIMEGWFKETLKDASTGHRTHNASTGHRTHNASTGDVTHNASTGDDTRTEIKGRRGVTADIGRGSRVKGVKGTLVCLCYYNPQGEPKKLVTGTIGKGGLKPDTWYGLDEHGNFAVME